VILATGNWLYLLTYPVYFETINVWNCHVAIIVSDRPKGTPLFYQRFAMFIELFKKSGYNQGYFEGKRTEVTAAYNFKAFHKCWRDEVTWGGARILAAP